MYFNLFTYMDFRGITPDFNKQKQRCAVQKVFLKILKNSHENICARSSFLIKLQISKLS